VAILCRSLLLSLLTKQGKHKRLLLGPEMETHSPLQLREPSDQRDQNQRDIGERKLFCLLHKLASQPNTTEVQEQLGRIHGIISCPYKDLTPTFSDSLLMATEALASPTPNVLLASYAQCAARPNYFVGS
jgi:hypothetical protein